MFPFVTSDKVMVANAIYQNLDVSIFIRVLLLFSETNMNRLRGKTLFKIIGSFSPALNYEVITTR